MPRRRERKPGTTAAGGRPRGSPNRRTTQIGQTFDSIINEILGKGDATEANRTILRKVCALFIGGDPVAMRFVLEWRFGRPPIRVKHVVDEIPVLHVRLDGQYLFEDGEDLPEGAKYRLTGNGEQAREG